MKSPDPSASSLTQTPSAFYHIKIWRAGLAITRLMPAPLLKLLFLCIAEVYYRLQPRRRKIVIQNLLPALKQDADAAKKAAHRLFHQFAFKLADLLRFESGHAVRSWMTNPDDWQMLQACRARGRGVLLVTPHLGNWEVGAPLLAERGVKLLVLTQPEPGDGLTELRVSSRANWGIETLVIGGDGFEFVKVIQKLQEGAVVALLIDRPPPVKAAPVTLFGQPFRASTAAAELARASGCAIIGVTVLREAGGYAARLLPEVEYDRQALGSREARLALSARIMQIFEPAIRQNLDQWFHFVPIWPRDPIIEPATNTEK